MSDAQQVIAFLNGPEAKVTAPLSAESSLIQSGLLDSLALFQLSLWIEAEIGRPLDLTAIEITAAWETPEAVARFIVQERNRAGP